MLYGFDVCKVPDVGTIERASVPSKVIQPGRALSSAIVTVVKVPVEAHALAAQALVAGVAFKAFALGAGAEMV